MKKWIGGAIILVGFAIWLWNSGWVVVGNPPVNPEQVASANATALRAQDESARYQKETQATATYLAARIVALPTQVFVELDSTGRTYQAQSWGWVGGVISITLIGLMIALLIYIRAHLIPRGKDGQLPGRALGDATVDMQRAVGPAVAVQNPSIADHFWHIVKRRALPEPRIVDAGATTEQLAAIAESANAVSATAAMFQPGGSNADRAGRLQITQKKEMRDPYGITRSPATTVIEASGDDAIFVLAEKAGIALPRLDADAGHTPTPSTIEIESSPEPRLEE